MRPFLVLPLPCPLLIITNIFSQLFFLIVLKKEFSFLCKGNLLELAKEALWNIFWNIKPFPSPPHPTRRVGGGTRRGATDTYIKPGQNLHLRRSESVSAILPAGLDVAPPPPLYDACVLSARGGGRLAAPAKTRPREEASVR